MFTVYTVYVNVCCDIPVSHYLYSIVQASSKNPADPCGCTPCSRTRAYRWCYWSHSCLKSRVCVILFVAACWHGVLMIYFCLHWNFCSTVIIIFLTISPDRNKYIANVAQNKHTNYETQTPPTHFIFWKEHMVEWLISFIEIVYCQTFAL